MLLSVTSLRSSSGRPSPTLENPSGEKVQSLFQRIPDITLGLEEGKRILNRSDCPIGFP